MGCGKEIRKVGRRPPAREGWRSVSIYINLSDKTFLVNWPESRTLPGRFQMFTCDSFTLARAILN